MISTFFMLQTCVIVNSQIASYVFSHHKHLTFIYDIIEYIKIKCLQKFASQHFTCTG